MSGVVYMFVLLQTFLTATHTISAIQTFIAGATAYRYVSVGMKDRCITFHTYKLYLKCPFIFFPVLK